MLNVDHETEVDFVDDFNLFNKALRGQILDHCVMSWDVHFSAHGNAHVSVWILQNNNLCIKIASASKYWPVKHINQHLLEVGPPLWQTDSKNVYQDLNYKNHPAFSRRLHINHHFINLFYIAHHWVTIIFKIYRFCLKRAVINSATWSNLPFSVTRKKKIFLIYN